MNYLIPFNNSEPEQRWTIKLQLINQKSKQTSTKIPPLTILLVGENNHLFFTQNIEKHFPKNF